MCGVASTVDEAVALADLHRPDLGIFDYRLADGGNGADIMGRVQHSKGLGVLYATGNEMGEALRGAEGIAFIQKPYTKKDVLDALKIVSSISARGEAAPRVLPMNFRLLENPLAPKRHLA